MSRRLRPVTRRAFLGGAAVTAAAAGGAVAAARLAGDSARPAATLRRTATPGLRPDTVAENSRPGDKDWWISRVGAPDEIAGYAGQASVLPGQAADLYVSTTAREFTVRAFRIGWYNGDLARKVWESGPVRGHRQRAPARTSAVPDSTGHVSPASAGAGPGSPVPASPVPATPMPASPVPASPVPARPVPASPVPASPVRPATGPGSTVPVPWPVPAVPAPRPAEAPEPAAGGLTPGGAA